MEKKQYNVLRMKEGNNVKLDLFQGIYEKIADYLPTEYEKLVFYAEHQSSAYKFEFFVFSNGTEWIKCYDLQDIELDDLLDSYEEINELITAVKEQDPVSNQWDILTITIDKSGRFSADYQYKDADFDEYQHNAIWRYKYLKEMPEKENITAYSAVTDYLNQS